MFHASHKKLSICSLPPLRGPQKTLIGCAGQVYTGVWRRAKGTTLVTGQDPVQEVPPAEIRAGG
jgi:hypothetical protein